MWTGVHIIGAVATKFYNCVIVGALGSDETSEQYPEGPVCEDCIAEESEQGIDSQIVSQSDSVNTDDDAECLLCGVTRDAE